MDMFDQGLVTESITLMIGYSHQLKVPASNGSISLPAPTNIVRVIMPYVLSLYESVAIKKYPIRRINIAYNKVVPEGFEQMTLFSDDDIDKEKDRKIQKATLEVRKKFGKNALVKGVSLKEGATGMDRNAQIGGHRSGE